jgi:hypothetical protein
MSSKFPVVLHLDCTFKCNNNEFPLLIFGITDAYQQFIHCLLALFLTKLKRCMRMCYTISIGLFPHVLTGMTFTPNYGMTDCEPAERLVIMFSDLFV